MQSIKSVSPTVFKELVATSNPLRKKPISGFKLEVSNSSYNLRSGLLQGFGLELVKLW